MSSLEVVENFTGWLANFYNDMYWDFVRTADYGDTQDVNAGSLVTAAYRFAPANKIKAVRTISNDWAKFVEFNKLSDKLVKVSVMNTWLANKRAELTIVAKKPADKLVQNSLGLLENFAGWLKDYNNDAFIDFILTSTFTGTEKVWSGSLLTQSYSFASPSKVALIGSIAEDWVNYSVLHGMEGGYIDVNTINKWLVQQRATFAKAKEAEEAKKEQGSKYDDGKLLMSLVQPEFTEAIADVLTFGAGKYGPNNWQKVDNAESRYMDALLRHLSAYRRGEDVDSESGLSHLAHAATNIMFILHFDRSKDENKS